MEDLGFETIGNACLIVHDRRPLLVTDPWIEGDAYFGSWTLYHDIPAEQMENIKKAKFVWVSHGHPDHLSSKSLKLLKDKTMLLPDHVGGRIRAALEEQGYAVKVLKDREWTKLSDRVRVLCIADYNQDGILLVDINGRLVANLNDSSDRGWARYVAGIIRGYEKSFLLRLSGTGDADMMNYFDEAGNRMIPPAAQKRDAGREIGAMVDYFGAKYFVPFSSMHRYQRTDSVWGNANSTGIDEYAKGFHSNTGGQILPAYIRYDCATDRWEKLSPTERKIAPREPREFGDDWKEDLTAEDKAKITKYFQAIEHLGRHFDFITLRVGGKDHVVELAQKRFNRGITFEAPRGSLMTSIEYEIFDDMLIGNFMKTTLHGNFPATGLYPDFTPYVAKYADNGLAKTEDELSEYFAAYRRRAPLEYLRHRLEKRSIDIFRNMVPMESGVYRFTKRVYRAFK